MGEKLESDMGAMLSTCYIATITAMPLSSPQRVRLISCILSPNQVHQFHYALPKKACSESVMRPGSSSKAKVQEKADWEDGLQVGKGEVTTVFYPFFLIYSSFSASFEIER